MDTDRCLQILREIKDVAFATVGCDGKPKVRIIDVMIVEGSKLYFCTARGKDFYEEIIANPNLAITGLNKDYQMVRIEGRARKLDEQRRWIDRIFKENPSMNSVYPSESRYILEPFVVDSGSLEFFDLGKEPIYRESLAFGNGEKQDKGYKITEECIGCNKCKNLCPQGCIEVGKPFSIRQENCLHCGFCYENCPVQAIERFKA